MSGKGLVTAAVPLASKEAITLATATVAGTVETTTLVIAVLATTTDTVATTTTVTE